jgi:hypothetical protein
MLRKGMDYLATHKVVDIALLVLITLLATRGWLNLDIPQGHDALGDMLLARAAPHTISLHGLLSGWSGDWFLGSPLFYVHPPLVSFLIRLLSSAFGWILGTKLLYLSFYVLSGVFAYLYVFQLTRSRLASLAAGLAYVFLPYHVLEVAFEGHHGAFGLPYMLTPLLLLCLEKLTRGPTLKLVLINSLLLAVLVLTYPQVFPILLGPFLALYVTLLVWRQRQGGKEYIKRAALASAAAFCLPLLLTAFWWLPLLSDIRNFAATSFPLDAAGEYSASFLQAITLRPAFCCAPASAYGASGSAFTEMLRLLPFALVALGAILNHRNRYVWFFSASILIAILLAMGPDSPVKLFSLAYRCVPFFSGLRTPWRFLLFASLAYAVLIGFCVKGVSEWLGGLDPRRLGRPGVSAIVLVLTSLIVVGNTWQETRTAFGTFTLTNDQREASEWLRAQDDGDYRITDLPFRTWTYTIDNRWMINPVYWTYLHGKDNVYGGVPAAAAVYAGETLEYLNYNLQNGSDLDEWLSLFNVRYVMIDKTDPTTASVQLGEGFHLVWPSTTIDIYENSAMKPRVFSVSTAGQRDVALWSADAINAFLVDGSQDVAMSLEDVHTRSSDRTLESRFQFSGSESEWSKLGIDVSDMTLGKDDALHLAFYSDQDLPNICASLDLLESDGSRYGMDLNRVDGIRAGWNEIDLPVSLLLLRYSTDENHRLDPGQVTTLWFGAGEQGDMGEKREFSLYFDSLSVVSQETNTDVEYAHTGPGKYQVHVNSDSPFRLILSESYYPDWVARVNGATIHSEISYESLNGFDFQPGEYDVTLEFVASPLRTAGTVISGICTLLSLLVGVVLLMKWRSSKAKVEPVQSS